MPGGGMPYGLREGGRRGVRKVRGLGQASVRLVRSLADAAEQCSSGAHHMHPAEKRIKKCAQQQSACPPSRQRNVHQQTQQTATPGTPHAQQRRAIRAPADSRVAGAGRVGARRHAHPWRRQHRPRDRGQPRRCRHHAARHASRHASRHGAGGVGCCCAGCRRRLARLEARGDGIRHFHARWDTGHAKNIPCRVATPLQRARDCRQRVLVHVERVHRQRFGGGQLLAALLTPAVREEMRRM